MLNRSGQNKAYSRNITQKSEIKFQDYVNLVQKRAGYYSSRFSMDYEELRAQSFEYYCLALEKYNPLKASFSTYLYTYVSGKLLLYCQQKRRYEGQDCLISEEESYEDFIASLKACENPSTEQFMAYANCFLTPTAHNILKWVVYEGITFIRSKDNRQLTVKALSKRFNVNAQIIQSAWKELFDFWNMKGAAFYASN